jgi:hypothetical protein
MMVVTVSSTMMVEVFVIIGLSFCRCAKNCVGFGDLDKALRGGRVIRIAIWVMSLRERVERSAKCVREP